MIHRTKIVSKCMNHSANGTIVDPRLITVDVVLDVVFSVAVMVGNLELSRHFWTSFLVIARLPNLIHQHHNCAQHCLESPESKQFNFISASIANIHERIAQPLLYMNLLPCPVSAAKKILQAKQILFAAISTFHHHNKHAPALPYCHIVLSHHHKHR